MIAWAAKYVGIPYRDHGATEEGCHCWGLVHLVLRREKSIEVPTYGELSAADLIRVAKAMRDDGSADPWQCVTTPREFDAVLMRPNSASANRRLTCHAGIMASDTHVLHVEESTDAVCVPIAGPFIRHRIAGFYRHKELQP